MLSKSNRVCGLTLIETIVGISIFLIVALGVYGGYTSIFKLVAYAKVRTLAMVVANEQIEVARTLPYDQVGIVAGIAAGLLLHQQQVVKSGTLFQVEISVRNIDDAFDGTIGGVPNDLAPADYKLIEVRVGCPSCTGFATTTVTSTIAPKNLESTGSNGALFVHVLDANGVPLPNASVHIVNTMAGITIDEVTNNKGTFALVDVPPGTFAYAITVTKAGYSTAHTYPSNDPDNPNPIALHATVATGALTELSLSIDRLSTLDLRTVRESCAPVGNIDFTLTGAKLIGSDPTLYKYQAVHQTDTGGLLTLPTLEWDSYSLALNEPSETVAGSIPLFPLSVNPGSTLNEILVLRPANPNALMVTVKDTATGLPLSDASVHLTGIGIDETLTTNRGFLTQSSWSGGAGQTIMIDATRYSSASAIDDGSLGSTAPGEVTLLGTLGTYAVSGSLESSVFDAGSASTTFYTIGWLPLDQATSTGADSVRFQIASSNDSATTTWNYLGPDGTVSTYYTIANTNVHAVHTNNRYVRYKLFLHTDDTSASPRIADVSLTFSSDCVPYGQVLFQGLPGGNHAITVSRTGYQTYQNDTVNTGLSWQEHSVSLSP